MTQEERLLKTEMEGMRAVLGGFMGYVGWVTYISHSLEGSLVSSRSCQVMSRVACDQVQEHAV